MSVSRRTAAFLRTPLPGETERFTRSDHEGEQQQHNYDDLTRLGSGTQHVVLLADPAERG